MRTTVCYGLGCTLQLLLPIIWGLAFHSDISYFTEEETVANRGTVPCWHLLTVRGGAKLPSSPSALQTHVVSLQVAASTRGNSQCLLRFWSCTGSSGDGAAAKACPPTNHPLSLSIWNWGLVMGLLYGWPRAMRRRKTCCLFPKLPWLLKIYQKEGDLASVGSTDTVLRRWECRWKRTPGWCGAGVSQADAGLEDPSWCGAGGPSRSKRIGTKSKCVSRKR